MDLQHQHPSSNSLVLSWFVNPDISETFCFVEEPVPESQKRPLCIRSKSRVMMGDDVTKDLEDKPKRFTVKFICLFGIKRSMH